MNVTTCLVAWAAIGGVLVALDLLDARKERRRIDALWALLTLHGPPAPPVVPPSSCLCDVDEDVDETGDDDDDDVRDTNEELDIGTLMMAPQIDPVAAARVGGQAFQRLRDHE